MTVTNITPQCWLQQRGQEVPALLSGSELSKQYTVANLSSATRPFLQDPGSFQVMRTTVALNAAQGAIKSIEAKEEYQKTKRAGDTQGSISAAFHLVARLFQTLGGAVGGVAASLAGFCITHKVPMAIGAVIAVGAAAFWLGIVSSILIGVFYVFIALRREHEREEINLLKQSLGENPIESLLEKLKSEETFLKEITRYERLLGKATAVALVRLSLGEQTEELQQSVTEGIKALGMKKLMGKATMSVCLMGLVSITLTALTACGVIVIAPWLLIALPFIVGCGWVLIDGKALLDALDTQACRKRDLVTNGLHTLLVIGVTIGALFFATTPLALVLITLFGAFSLLINAIVFYKQFRKQTIAKLTS